MEDCSALKRALDKPVSNRTRPVITLLFLPMSSVLNSQFDLLCVPDSDDYVAAIKRQRERAIVGNMFAKKKHKNHMSLPNADEPPLPKLG